MRSFALIAIVTLAPAVLPAGNKLTWEDRVELTRGLTAESGRSTWVTLDGEPMKLKGGVEVLYKKNALTVIAPKQAPANDNAHRASVRSSLSG